MVSGLPLELSIFSPPSHTVHQSQAPTHSGPQFPFQSQRVLAPALHLRGGVDREAGPVEKVGGGPGEQPLPLLCLELRSAVRRSGGGPASHTAGLW